MFPRSNLDLFLLLVHPVHKQEVRISEATKDEGDEESFLSLGKVDELDYLLDRLGKRWDLLFFPFRNALGDNFDTQPSSIITRIITIVLRSLTSRSIDNCKQPSLPHQILWRTHYSTLTVAE